MYGATSKLFKFIGSRVWWRWFWDQGNCPDTVDAVVLDSDDNVAIIDYFEILPVEDVCTVIILDLSY